MNQRMGLVENMIVAAEKKEQGQMMMILDPLMLKMLMILDPVRGQMFGFDPHPLRSNAAWLDQPCRMVILIFEYLFSVFLICISPDWHGQYLYFCIRVAASAL